MIGRIRALSVFFVILALGFPQIARSQQSPEDILRTLQYRSGKITLGDNLAELSLGNSFRYLNNADTQTFLTKVWQNPPGAGQDALGMLLPVDSNPLAGDGWVAVLTYEASGYVSDEDAEKIDYDRLLKEMQESVREASKKRVADGYSSLELVGWAREPYYDKAAKKMYWAKRLRFGGQQRETLNYEIRILGRRGVLDLNVVAPIGALAQIDTKANAILAAVSFKTGNTYAEFNPSIDEAAAYGLAGLIAGGILTKAGFFKGLLALLLVSKKVVAIGIFAGAAGLWAGLKRFFSRRRGKPAGPNA
jgi:uncharacterized membrane-anchored protein